MEPEGSLPHLHEPTYHLPSFRARLIQSAPYHPISLLNILILPFYLSLGLQSGLFRVSPSNPVLFFSHTYYTLRPSYPSSVHANNVWWAAHIKKHLITQFCPQQRSRYTDWVRAGRFADRIPVEDRILCTRPDQPWGPPSLLYNRYGVIPRGKAAGMWR